MAYKPISKKLYEYHKAMCDAKNKADDKLVRLKTKMVVEYDSREIASIAIEMREIEAKKALLIQMIKAFEKSFSDKLRKLNDEKKT